MKRIPKYQTLLHMHIYQYLDVRCIFFKMKIHFSDD